MTKKQLENKYTLARRAFENQHFDEAYSYYKEILNEEPNDFEAAFRSIISRANISTLASFKEITSSLTFEISRLFSLESLTSLDSEEKLKTVKNAEKEFTQAIISCEQAASAHYIEFSNLSNALSEYRSQLINLSFACGRFGETIYDEFDDEEIKKICVNPLKNAIALLKKSAMGFSADIFSTSLSTIGNYDMKIRKFEANYVNPCYEAMKKESPSQNTNRTSSKGLNPAAKFSLWLSIACIIGGIISCCIGEITAIGVGVGLIVFGVFFLFFVPTINGN